jgi:hypothetical protein
MNHRLPAILSLLALDAALAAAATAARSADEPFRPQPLTRDAEVRAALAAGPAHFAAAAGVYVLTEKGFELERPSQNGFHCLVQRSHPGAFEPQCFDEEGSRTLLREVLLRGELQAQGGRPSEIAREVAAAYADGRLRAPSRPGINYMLSPENRVPIDDEGSEIIPYRPHLMFYVPYLTNADLGSDGAPGAPVFVIGEGTPGAYAIVPVPLGDGAGHGAGH